MRKCFDSLDEDKGGSISTYELETPLIGLGFAENQKEVEDLVREVDADMSGEIDFDEFVLIIKNSNKGSKINSFFKDLT